MSNPTCTTASLNIACFRGYNLTRLQKLAWRIWYLANELSSIGGTNYTNSFTLGTPNLLNDTIQQFSHWDMDAMDSAMVAIDFNNAIAAGALVSSDPNVTIPHIRRVTQIDEIMLKKMEIELLCQLGRHKSYPQ